MNKINETTYFDYLDGLLDSQDKKEFENYITNNPKAKSKLDKLIQEESIYNNKIEGGEFEKISDKYSFEINQLQEKINKHIKKSVKKNSLLNFVQNMFQPLWEIPMQAKGVVLALPVGVYLFATSFVPMQSYQNQFELMNIKLKELENNNNEVNQIAVTLKEENHELNKLIKNLMDEQSTIAAYDDIKIIEKDTFMQMASLVPSDFLLFSEKGEIIAFELNNNSWNIENVTISGKKRSAAQSSDLTCANNLDNKIIEIFPTDNPLNKRTLTYCSDIDKNNWRLLNIEIKKDEKPLKLNSNYKLVFEKDSIFLFPEVPK